MAKWKVGASRSSQTRANLKSRAAENAPILKMSRRLHGNGRLVMVEHIEFPTKFMTEGEAFAKKRQILELLDGWSVSQAELVLQGALVLIKEVTRVDGKTDADHMDQAQLFLDRPS